MLSWQELELINSSGKKHATIYVLRHGMFFRRHKIVRCEAKYSSIVKMEYWRKSTTDAIVFVKDPSISDFSEAEYLKKSLKRAMKIRQAFVDKFGEERTTELLG